MKLRMKRDLRNKEKFPFRTLKTLSSMSIKDIFSVEVNE